MNGVSQYDEAEKILELVGNKDDGFFIDIGAFDGITISNTANLLEKGWGGLLIEPNPYSFVKLSEFLVNYPKALALRCAIGIGKRELDFCCFKEAGLSTGVPEFMSRLLEEGHLTPTRTLVTLLHPRCLLPLLPACEIDLLSVDTEGMDIDIILSFPFDGIKPRVVVCEVDKASWNEKGDKRLSSFGYEKVHSTKGNAIWKL